jgi:hypothetical protein
VASDPAYRRSEFRGFRPQGNLHRGFAIREIPKRTWQGGGPQDLVGNRCQGVRPHHEMPTGGVRSEFRGSEFCVA